MSNIECLEEQEYTTTWEKAEPIAATIEATQEVQASIPMARSTTESVLAAPSGISWRLVLIFAAACGLVVANLTYAQPVLANTAQTFHSSSAAAGLVVTLTQIGYALGLMFLVPLGDLVDRRRLIVLILCGTTVALLGAAFAPTLAALAGLMLVVGVTSVVAQILVPFSASLANDAERGKVVGTVMSGLLIGALLARTFSGLMSQVAGWRAIFVAATVLMVALIALLWRAMPQPPRQRNTLTARSYGQLLLSVLTLVREEPILRRRSIYGALVFATFSVLWTSVAFLLARPPYHYNQAVIGLFGLLGVAGALCASVAGRLADRGWARYSTGSFFLTILAAFALLALGTQSLLPLIAGIVLLDLGVQGAHITNQSEIYRLHPEARSRLTTAYMTTYFFGGALGSFTPALAYQQHGWLGICLLGAGYAVLILLYWLTEFVGARRTSH